MVCLQATELRAAGVAEARIGNMDEAIQQFTAALAANPPQGNHLIYANRSAAYRSIGHHAEALADADAAVACAPEGFSTAFIRQASFSSSYHAVGTYVIMREVCHAKFT